MENQIPSSTEISTSQILICKKCGAKVPAKTKFCPNCGKKIAPLSSKIAKKKKKGSKKKLFLIGGIATIFAIAVGILLWYYLPILMCEHEWYSASCIELASCKKCRITEGELGEHSWENATCISPQTCSVCGKEEGELGEHSWENATCISPQTCSVCGKEEGELDEHSWENATCTSPQTCSVCGITSGSRLDHNLKNFICTHCGETVVTSADVPKIINITELSGKCNSVGGIDFNINYENTSKKTIKYLRMNVSFINAVGDLLYCDITGDSNATIYSTGPVAPGEIDYCHWKAILYTGNYEYNQINWIKIEYMDGTSIYLERDLAHEAVEHWRK